MRSEQLDRVKSDLINDRIAPVVAEFGIINVLLALANRLTTDSSAIAERFSRQNPVAHRLGTGMARLAVAVRGVVDQYHYESHWRSEP